MLQKQDKKLALKSLNPANVRIAIIRTDYHQELNDNLEKHAKATLLDAGLTEENIEIFNAPGSWEIPFVAKVAAETKKFDAIIAFGIIVKGETYHFEMIANECSRALMQLSQDHSMPVAIEILAVFEKEQAIARAGDNDHNKGIEGAQAVLKALDVALELKH